MRPPAARHVVVVGDVITDLIVRLREPLAPASDTRTTIEPRAGGSGANVAAWLATAGLVVHIVGRVGDDPFGAYHREELRRHGVTPHLAVDPNRPTGSVVALIDPSGERSMLTDRGANLGLTRADLPSALFRAGAHLHLSGYALFEPETRDAALSALAWARERGMTVSMDPSSVAPLRAAGPARFMEWTRGVDLCFPNLDEGRALSGEDTPEAIARALSAHYGEVALKLGAAGALWARQGEPPVALPAAPAAVVDSTGAGDAFCAGFLSRWLAGATAAKALASGLSFGASAAARVGARPEAPA